LKRPNAIRDSGISVVEDTLRKYARGVEDIHSECCLVLFVKVILYSYLILKKMNERITDS